MPKEFEFDIEALRTRFRELRRAQKMTQAQAASELEVTQAAVSAFERGKNVVPRGKMLQRVMALIDQWSTREEISNRIPFPSDRAAARSNSVLPNDGRRADPLLDLIRDSLIQFLGPSPQTEMLVSQMSRSDLMYAHLLQKNLGVDEQIG